MKLFRKRKPENAEEEDDLLSDGDPAEEGSIRDVTEAATEGSTDPPAQTGAFAPALDPVAQMRADAAAEVASENPLEGAPATPQAGDLESSLLDIFTEAKEEMEEATLASQLPDIPIQELLGDLVTLSQCLGVKPRPRLSVSPLEEGELSIDPDEGGK